MSHVDDGWLHAYVDGELTAFEHDVPDVEAHLAQCPECRRRLEDAEARVGQLEARIAAVTRELEDPALYMRAHGRSDATRLGAELDRLKVDLDGALEEWSDAESNCASS